MDENARELCKREERLFTKKAPLDQLNQELALNFYPERADFTTEQALGEEFGVDIFDSEPLRCRRDLANARASMLRPGDQQWFKAQSGDKETNEQPHIAKHFDAMNARAKTLIYKPDTGFVDAEKMADHDVVTFGYAVKTIESEIDRNGKRILMVRCWHPRDNVWLDDRNGVRQDFHARRFKASARHIKQQFPNVELAAAINNAIDKEPDKEFDLCHVMMRADEYEYYKKPARGRKAPWVSVYYDSKHKMLLRERPSERFRYILDRWGRLQGSQYAYSPAAMTALPDGRGMQTMAMVLLDAAEKSLDPPLKATRGAVLGEIRNVGGGVTWVEKEYNEKLGPAIAPLLPGNINPGIGIDMVNRATFGMRDNWFLTKLTLPQQAKTAFETQALLEEYIRANLPLFEPWEAAIGMTLDEIFAVLIEMGEFGPLDDWPRELSGAELEFAFANPLRDAIGKNKVNMAQVIIGTVAGIAKISPEAGRQNDWGEIERDVTRGSGAPANWLRDEDDVAEEKAQQQQVGNVAQAMGAAGQAAEIANTGLEAAGKLQEMNQPAVDGSAVYGPA